MTICTRLFGYAISLSFDKAIRIPIDKLSNEFRKMEDGSEPPLQNNEAPTAVTPHDAITEPSVHTVRF